MTLFLISIYFLKKDKIQNLSYISLGYLLSIVFILIYIFIQMPFFYSEYEARGELEVTMTFKPFNLLWISSFFAYISSFNS